MVYMRGNHSYKHTVLYAVYPSACRQGAWPATFSTENTVHVAASSLATLCAVEHGAHFRDSPPGIRLMRVHDAQKYIPNMPL